MRDRRLVKELTRVELLVAEEFECAPVKLIGSTPRNDVHHRSGGPAKLSREGIFVHLEFLDPFCVHARDAILAPAVSDRDCLRINAARVHPVHQKRDQAH